MKQSRESSGPTLAVSVERFVREIVVPYERDPRLTPHGPSASLVRELRERALKAGLLTPIMDPDGAHLSLGETALVLRAAGLSPLGPVALNVAAPDEGNMFLLSKVASDEQKRRYLGPLIRGKCRSAFLMTEPATSGGAGSDPSMMKTRADLDGDEWVVNGEKTFITGMDGARFAIVMARTGSAATMFLVDLPNAHIKIERILDTIDSSMPGGHAVVSITNLRVPVADVLGASGEGFKSAQVRLSPARLSHCMRWHGAATRAQEIATRYSTDREAFGKSLIDHEAVGFMLVDNLIDLKQSELLIDWCAQVLDSGSLGLFESSLTKAAVSEALFRVADRCVQVMGGTGVSRDSVVEQIFREIRAFRIYDGPTEVHKWSLAKAIKRRALSERTSARVRDGK